MAIVAIVQARMGSARLPGKVLRPIVGIPMIELLLDRLSVARSLDRIVVATSDTERDDPLVAHVEALGHPVFRGSEPDVLDRYYRAAREHGAHVVVRITADCPLIDPGVVDSVVDAFRAHDVDYASNTSPRSYPRGLDTEVFGIKTLEVAWRLAADPAEREHVTPFMKDPTRSRIHNVAHDTDLSDLRWTVDLPEDLVVITNVFEHFHPRHDFGWLEVLALQRSRPQLFAANQHVTQAPVTTTQAPTERSSRQTRRER